MIEFLACMIVASVIISIALPIWEHIADMGIRDWIELIITDNLFAIGLYVFLFC